MANSTNPYKLDFQEINARLQGIELILEQLTFKVNFTMASLSDLNDAVQAQVTVEESVVSLLEQLSSELQAAVAANDPAALQAVVDHINANTTALSNAVVANTPAAP